MSAPSTGKAHSIRRRGFICRSVSPLFAPVYSETLSPDWTSALSAVGYFKHVRFLASDDLKGRGNGSPELQRASEYIASQFRSLGLKPAGDKGTYFENFQITTGTAYGQQQCPDYR